MSTCSIDIECYEYIDGVYRPVLDATKLVLAVVKHERWKKHKVFYKKEELWNYLIELGKAEAKRGAVLNVYAHNANFDSSGYFDFTDKHIKFLSMHPFIASYKLSREEAEELGIKIQGQYKEIIKFLDTWSIFRMPLSNVAKTIGMEKLEMPEIALEIHKDEPTKQLEIIEEYCARDVDITLKAIQTIKDKLEKEGVRLKRLYTISQIAIGYLTNKLIQLKHNDTIKDFLTGEFHECKHPEDIHKAYRGGRVEAFKTGEFENCCGIDVNSLYPYITTIMAFPNLKTERKINKPLEITGVNTLLDNIGVARARVKNEECEIGLIPIITPTGSHYIKKGQEAIGTWTLLELRKAKENGHEIKDIEWAIIWDEGNNPFKEVTPQLYRLRKKGNEFDNFFYKMMMNASYGKLAQHNGNAEYAIDSVEELDKYLDKKYEFVRGIGDMYMYKRKNNYHKKKYYSPIIPALINAQARILMYDVFKRIGAEKLLYTDTDSAFWEGDWINFPISKEMGEFSCEAENVRGRIYGRKAKRFGDKINVSGVVKININEENFEEGYIEHSRMLGYRSTTEFNKIGTFEKQGRDLNKQEEDYRIIKNKLAEEDFLVDCNIENINYFLYRMS